MAHLLRGHQGAEVLGVDGVDSILGRSRTRGGGAG